MRHKRFGLLLSSAAVVAMLGACTTDDGAKETTGGGDAPATQAASAPAEVASTAPTLDEATRKACTELLASIDKNLKVATDAEKIGPPAGHIAAGAAYIAASADIYAKSIGTNPVVTDAADKVADEMDAMDKAWQKDPDKKPARTDLNKAITGLKTACGES